MKNKNSYLKVISVCFYLYLPLFLFSCNASISEKSQEADKICTSGEFIFSGHIGQYINTISEKRILDLGNWNKIYPETENAFYLREDDKDYPERGVWRGEFWGKYILSVIAAQHYYHSDELKDRVRSAVKGLLTHQEENGYIGTYSHSDFVVGNNWNIWSRKYTLWGLIEAWELLQDDSILLAAINFTDHLISEVGPNSVDIIQTGNFYGLPSTSILQPMVKLYNATEDEKYLQYAEYIVAQWSKHPDGLPNILINGLTEKPVQDWFMETDPYRWAKGYEFISCVEGLAELYKATGKQQYFDAAKNIHNVLVKWERTPIGSVSFQDKIVGSAGLINTLSEVCDAVYWNRLSYKLFQITGDESYIDEIERTLYNSLLSSFNPEGTWGLRRLRMSHTHIPAQNHFLQHHQCCTDNLPRGLFQAAEVVLTKRDDKVYLSLFNEGKGQIMLPSGQMSQIKIEGDFLEEGSIKTTILLAKPEKFNFLIRMPRWSENTEVKINGINQKGNTTGDWMSIERMWNDKDEIEISFDLNVRWEKFETENFVKNFHDIPFYEKEWAKLQFGKSTNEELNRKYGHVKSLSPDDALPHKRAVTFFYGPIALARDVRITKSDIFAPINFSDVGNNVQIHPIETRPGIWKAFELNLGQGEKINFCDFSSAGNTWDNNSIFNTWCILNTK